MKHLILRSTTLGFIFLVAASGALLHLNTDVAADGPVADFPTFTPWTSSMEGVAVDKVGNVYVSIMDIGLIWKFAPDGTGGLFANLGGVRVGGLVIDANGDLYATVLSAGNGGVCRIDREGLITYLPGTEQIAYPNGLSFDQRGNLYVTESFSFLNGSFGQGGIWRIPAGGDAELWLRDDLLTGTGLPLGFPLGANGIAFYHGDLYVANSDKGLVVRIPIMPKGAPGQAHVWAELQEVYADPTYPFLMGDGLALDVHGNVYVAMVSRAAVVRITAVDKVQETLAARFPNLDNAPLLPLDTPASLAFGTGKGGRAVLFVTNLGWSFANPGLIKMDLDTPGLPLP